MKRYLQHIKNLAALKAANPRTPGARIKLVRNLHGLNQTKMAKIAGISLMTLSMWENDKTRKFDTKPILKIGLHFGVAARWLVMMTDDPAGFLSVPAEEQEILGLFRLLPPDQQENAKTILESLARKHQTKPTSAFPYPALDDVPENNVT